MTETLRFTARHAWCEQCMELVGQPRVTVRKAREDLLEHRRAGHPEPVDGETVRHQNGQYGVLGDNRRREAVDTTDEWDDA